MLEKLFKCLKDKGRGSYRITSIGIQLCETHKHWGAETAQYGPEITLARCVMSLYNVFFVAYSGKRIKGKPPITDKN